MFAFDNAKFIDGFKQRFGPVIQDLAAAIEFLLGKIEADGRFAENPTDRFKLSYCLATFKWETAHTLQPIDEHGGDAYFNRRYGPGTDRARCWAIPRPATAPALAAATCS